MDTRSYETPASVKAKVANSIFNHPADAIEIQEIEARLAELEQAAEITEGAADKRGSCTACCRIATHLSGKIATDIAS